MDCRPRTTLRDDLLVKKTNVRAVSVVINITYLVIHGIWGVMQKHIYQRLARDADELKQRLIETCVGSTRHPYVGYMTASKQNVTDHSNQRRT